jgi:hypothetical protein
MKSIRKFAVATLFSLSALSLSAPTASAEVARGHFNLSHEVHWQDAVLAAGEYEFSVGEEGPSDLLMIRKLSGDRAGYMLLVQDTRPSQATDLSRLVLVSRPTGSFVDRMELPEFGMTLRFKVPAGTAPAAHAHAVAATPSGN